MNTDDSLHKRGRALIMFILKGLNRKGTHTKHSLISTAGEVDWVKKMEKKLTRTHTEDSIKATRYYYWRSLEGEHERELQPDHKPFSRQLIYVVFYNFWFYVFNENASRVCGVSS